MTSRVPKRVSFASAPVRYELGVITALLHDVGKSVSYTDERYCAGRALSVKSLLQSMRLQLNTHRGEDYTGTWYEHLWTAFGVKGVIAPAFWLGSLLAEQIRATDKSFPFLG